MKKYLIGELAKAMGVSHEYLKYYEKNNVIKCERNEDSKYRYFTFADAGKVADTKKYRNMGFTVKEVKNIIWEYSLKNTIELYKQKRNSLSNDLFKIQGTIEYIDEVLNCFSSGEFINDKWYIIDQNEFFFFPHTQENTFYLNEIDSLRVQNWIDVQPLTYKTLFVPIEVNDSVSNHEYLYGFWADKSIVDKLNLDIGKPVQHINSGRCFVYYFKAVNSGSDNNIDKDFRPSAISYINKPLSILKQCGLTPSISAGYCKLLHQSKNNNYKENYWALYIPIL